MRANEESVDLLLKNVLTLEIVNSRLTLSGEVNGNSGYLFGDVLSGSRGKVC